MIYSRIYFTGLPYVLENIYETIDMIMIIVIWNYLVWYIVIWMSRIDTCSSKRRHSSLWIILQFSKLHVPAANSVFTSCNHTQHNIARCFFHIIHGAVWAIRYMIKTEISKSQIAHSRHHESFRNADGSLRQRTRRLIASVSRLISSQPIIKHTRVDPYHYVGISMCRISTTIDVIYLTYNML